MKRIGIDIETDLSHTKIHIVKTIDLDTGDIKTWKAAKPLAEFLKDATLIAAHNGIGFDFKVLTKHWNTTIAKSQQFDTLILSRLLEPSRESGHSLESWGEALGVKKTPYKKIWEWMNGRVGLYPGECYDEPIESLLDFYCEGDVKVLRELFHHLTKLKESHKFSDQSVQLEFEVARIITEQEDNGFKLDIPYATVLLTDIKTKMAGIYEQMQERWPPYSVERYSEKTGKRLKDSVVVFNPGSRKQVGEKLIELGWKPTKFTETGQPVVDEGSLAGVDFPEAKMIAEYFLLQKRVAQIESWIEAVGDDGRVHGRCITNGAVTGRATHSSPNIAQVPNTSALYGAECRTCWTVEPGNVQVGVDLSGIELRCLSHYMQDPEWQKELLEGDVHWKNTQAFGLVPMGTEKTDTKEHKDKRNTSKTLTYSVLYGAGPAKVGSTVNGTAKDGAKLIDNFFNNTPALKKFVKKLDVYITKGFVPGLDGRKIWIRSDHAALNSLLQSAGAIIAKQWLVCMTEELTKQNIPYKLLAWVHDEVQLETPKQYGDAVGKIVADSATRAGEILKFRCPVAAEYRVGANWYDCH